MRVWQSRFEVVEQLRQTDGNNKLTRTFKVTMHEPIGPFTSFSETDASIVKNNVADTTDIIIRGPSEGGGAQRSTSPLTGGSSHYRISCPDIEDPSKTWTTPDLDWEAGEAGINEVLQRTVPWMAFNIHVKKPRAFVDVRNGLAVAIIMQNLNSVPGEIPKCEIISSEDFPIPDDSAYVTRAETIRERG